MLIDIAVLFMSTINNLMKYKSVLYASFN